MVGIGLNVGWPEKDSGLAVLRSGGPDEPPAAEPPAAEPPAAEPPAATSLARLSDVEVDPRTRSCVERFGSSSAGWPCCSILSPAGLDPESRSAQTDEYTGDVA